MFWLKRLKEDQDDSSWAVSYGDLMSLLLAVFVMIAAMSDLRVGPRFISVREAVRGAFGFDGQSDVVDPASAPERRWSMVERLQHAGLRTGDSVRGDLDDEALEPCDLVTESDRLVIRVAGPVTFDRFSAALKPHGSRALTRVAAFLVGGQAQIEVRGHGGDGALPESVPFRDELDLSYERARAAADLLRRAGVEEGRIRITAWGGNEPLDPGPAASMSEGVNRRIEIIVHAAQAASHDQVFAEKERVRNG